MELGPIVRAMRANATRVTLLVLEIGVTLAIVLNCLTIIADQRARLSTPSGVDEEHIVGVRVRAYGESYASDAFVTQLIERDVTALRALPGVVDACSIQPWPLQGGGSSSMVRAMGADETAAVRAPFYYGDDHVVSTLGLDLVAGREFTADEVIRALRLQPMPVIVTKDLVDTLFPGTDGLGQVLDVWGGEVPATIVGVVRAMHTPYGGGPMESRIVLVPAVLPQSTGMRYLIRTDAGSFDATFAAAEETLLANDPDRLVQVRSMAEIKRSGYADNHAVAGILTLVTGLLLLVTTIGIFGMASFSVTQRTRQIGTRRALGGTRYDIVRYFLLESAIIAAFGIALGLAGAYGLNLVLVASMDGTPLPLGLSVAGAVGLLVLALAATALPARRAAAVPPAVATRTV